MIKSSVNWSKTAVVPAYFQREMNVVKLSNIL